MVTIFVAFIAVILAVGIAFFAVDKKTFRSVLLLGGALILGIAMLAVVIFH